MSNGSSTAAQTLNLTYWTPVKSFAANAAKLLDGMN
jgi:hypothetical protein